MNRLLQMENEIRRLGLYRALLTGRIAMSSVLFMSLIYYVLDKSTYSSPLYILIFLNIAPSFFNLTNRRNGNETESPFPMLRKKYHYTLRSYRHNLYAFFSSCVLIVIWQLFQSKGTGHWSYIIPIICLTTSMCVYFISAYVFTRKIKNQLLTGDV